VKGTSEKVRPIGFDLGSQISGIGPRGSEQQQQGKGKRGKKKKERDFKSPRYGFEVIHRGAESPHSSTVPGDRGESDAKKPRRNRHIDGGRKEGGGQGAPIVHSNCRVNFSHKEEEHLGDEPGRGGRNSLRKADPRLSFSSQKKKKSYLTRVK